MARNAFSLVEMLVAMAIFISLMLVASIAFASFSSTADEARQSLAIHARSESLERFLRERLCTTPSFTAIRLVGPQDSDEEEAITFMFSRYIDQQQYDHCVSLDLKNLTGISDMGDEPLMAELLWGHLEWRDDGILRFACSNVPICPRDTVYGTNDAIYLNFRRNHRVPTPQRLISHLIGRDDVPTKVGQPFRSFEVYDSYSKLSTPLMKLADLDGDGERLDDYEGEHGRAHWLGMLISVGFFGNRGTAVDGAFAVANADGRLFNKDWINLVGVKDSPTIYPDQRRVVFDHVECFELIPLDADGDELGSEADSMGDGSDSRDWAGRTWGGDRATVTRPAAFECRVLIHEVRSDQRDDDDVDGDGDYDESLLSGLRRVLSSDGSRDGNQQQRRDMKAALAEYGYPSQIFTYTIPLPH